MGNTSQFQSKKSKPETFQFVIFPAVCVQLLKLFLSLESSKHSKANKQAMQYFVLKRVTVFCFNDSDELEMKKNPYSTFMQSSELFERNFHPWKNENVHQRTNALFCRLFESQLQF